MCQIIEEHEFSDFKTPLQIRVEKQDYQTFILQTAKSKIYDQDYYIVLLDSIQKVIEKKEKEAWINLMKVISHELMNSLTPIHALAQNLQETTQQDSLSAEDISDIKESIETITNRTRHLQQFVENYRKLAAFRITSYNVCYTKLLRPRTFLTPTSFARLIVLAVARLT